MVDVSVVVVELFASARRFARWSRTVARGASSLWRASTALLSRLKTPWRNLSDSEWIASWIEASSMLARSSWNEVSDSPVFSTSALGSGSAATAASAAEERTDKRTSFLKETISDLGV